VEALVRWNDPDGAMIYPDGFIPMFEKNGFVTKLDMYMLEKACQCIVFWKTEGITPVPISVNFSKLHLKNQGFVEEIASIVKKH
ncbi:MAG: EAL domain-containing protein, partial [Oscillospiraceae bacterium]